MWVFLLCAAWVAALFTCTRLCRVSLAAADDPVHRAADPPPALTLQETAYLAGGPGRLTDLVLVTMSREGRLLLAHTGWATLLDDRPRDAVEAEVVTLLGGAGGQAPVPELRASLAGTDGVRALAGRLAAAGLAVPDTVRSAVTTATRQVRGAAVLVLVAAAVAETAGFMAPDTTLGSVAPWFALPLLLTGGCLLISRLDRRPCRCWASAAGRDQLRHAPPTDAGRGLAALALRGPGALPEPELRTALGAPRSPLRTH